MVMNFMVGSAEIVWWTHHVRPVAVCKMFLVYFPKRREGTDLMTYKPASAEVASGTLHAHGPTRLELQ